MDGRFGGVSTRQKSYDIQAIRNDVFVGMMGYEICIYICIHVGLFENAYFVPLLRAGLFENHGPLVPLLR